MAHTFCCEISERNIFGKGTLWAERCAAVWSSLCVSLRVPCDMIIASALMFVSDISVGESMLWPGLSMFFSLVSLKVGYVTSKHALNTIRRLQVIVADIYKACILLL
jgi:hypothetical protein